MNIHKEFNIDKVICDIDVRYYIDCAFSKDNGETWEEDFDDEYIWHQGGCDICGTRSYCCSTWWNID